MAEDKRTLTITTARSQDFRILPAEGALGGITPNRMFQINFYTEAPTIPQSITHELREDGGLGPQLGAKTEGGQITRELHSAVLMTIPQAESLAKWIIATIKNQSAAVHTPDSGVVM